MEVKPLEKAIELAGSQEALGALIGSDQTTISYWLTKCDGVVPAEKAKKIERALNSQVTCQQLRPDIFNQ